MQNIIRNIDSNDIISLAGPQYEACISIYMAEEKTGRDTRKNAILFKELCHRAEEKLIRYGIEKDAVSKLLAPLKELEKDEGFWQTRDQGLAVFRSADMLKTFLLPVAFEPMEIVDQHFYIRPLLAAHTPQGVSHVLVVNREDIRLITMDEKGQQERRPPEQLRSYKKFMENFEFAEHAQFHSGEGAPRGGSNNWPVFQGEGTADDEAPDNYYLGVYYHQVKNWLEELSLINQDRLYLVGDTKNTGVFVETAKDMNCSFEVLIEKNANAVTMEDIRDAVHEKNRLIYESAFERSTEDLLQIEASQPERVLTDTAEILAAAHNQRIRTLFIPASNNSVWGHFDESNQGIEIEDNDNIQGGVGEELINLAAIRTLLNNGEVVPLPDKAMFEKVPHFAAICRW